MTNDVIRLLPDSVANQIAAGEVIQRPASVIKELVENSVDAGADSIEIILTDAGRTLIQVIDNGCGMSDTDARMAFERHATSKIKNADDLFALSTMGFRGEALASIAAVAQVDLRTMRKGEAMGTRIIINGSVVESQEPAACTPGSNMMVRNLFFNVPARRKFLKKDSVELSNILREFERLALVNPGVELSISHNGTPLHRLMKAPTKRRIADLFGKTLEQQLIPVETDTSIVRISGFIGLPQYARKRNQLQYLFVNGRNMRHPYFHKAVMSCYEQLLPADVQPNYFIDFHVDPATIDVNIHPTKNEIKFENEAGIWQILVAAVKESLGRFNASGAIDFDMADAPEIPVFGSGLAEASSDAPDLEIDPDYNPFARNNSSYNPVSEPRATSPSYNPTASSDIRPHRLSSINTTDWEKLYDDFTGRRDNDTPEPLPVIDIPSSSDKAVIESSYCPYINIKGKYIVSAAKSGMMIVDRHRAHLRVLYDNFLDLYSRKAFSSQQVLFPEVIELNPSMSQVMRSIADELAIMGFEISFLGGNSWTINGIPSVLSDSNPRSLLLNILENAADNNPQPTSLPLTRKVALAMAEAAAVTASQPVTPEEMTGLMSDLLKLSSPDFTPDGRPVITIITTDEIASRLK